MWPGFNNLNVISPVSATIYRSKNLRTSHGLLTKNVSQNDIDPNKNSVKVTQLDIDYYGSIVPLSELELNVSSDQAILQTLKHSSDAAIFTAESDQSTIILATGMTIDELNQEKSRTIDKANASHN